MTPRLKQRLKGRKDEGRKDAQVVTGRQASSLCGIAHELPGECQGRTNQFLWVRGRRRRFAQSARRFRRGYATARVKYGITECLADLTGAFKWWGFAEGEDLIRLIRRKLARTPRRPAAATARISSVGWTGSSRSCWSSGRRGSHDSIASTENTPQQLPAKVSSFPSTMETGDEVGTIRVSSNPAARNKVRKRSWTSAGHRRRSGCGGTHPQRLRTQRLLRRAVSIVHAYNPLRRDLFYTGFSRDPLG
jgi:hypothetical protein